MSDEEDVSCGRKFYRVVCSPIAYCTGDPVCCGKIQRGGGGDEGASAPAPAQQNMDRREMHRRQHSFLRKTYL